MQIRATARVLGATLKAGETVEYRFAGADRYGYLVPAKRRVEVDGTAVNARNGAAISGQDSIRVTAVDDAEVVLVDAPR